MNPAERLQVDKSGVYRTPADGPNAVTAQRADASMEADLARVRDKPGLMRAFARDLEFPSDFGDNWDALSDSLQDLSWRPASAYVLRLRNAANAKRSLGDEWPMLLEILRESAMYWKARGKVFIVFVDGAEELPEWN